MLLSGMRAFRVLALSIALLYPACPHAQHRVAAIGADVALTARPGAPASQQHTAESDTYLALLGRYEAGDYQGAADLAARLDVDTARRLARLMLDEVDREMDLLKRLAAASTEASTRGLLNQLRRERVRRLTLSLLVHTEAAVRLSDVNAFAGQLTLAREAVGRLRRVEEGLGGSLDTGEREAIRTFIRDWYLVVASRLQAGEHLAFLKTHVREGLELFRDDPELLLTRGTISESEADRAIVDRSLAREIYAPDFVQRWREFMSAAGGDYQAATRRRPEMYEATLRWGRICSHLGDRNEARRALDEVAASDGPAHLRYLAHLFLGVLAEREQQPDRARAAYESALALVPTAQAPMLALSLLCDGAGEPECARRWLSRSMAATGRGRLDPWWAYQRGQAWLGDSRLVAFRARGLQK
jgi:tetratricopeptide (TPR) repeat protein